MTKNIPSIDYNTYEYAMIGLVKGRSCHVGEPEGVKHLRLQ
jgi:hypothetical protein